MDLLETHIYCWVCIETGSRLLIAIDYCLILRSPRDKLFSPRNLSGRRHQEGLVGTWRSETMKRKKPIKGLLSSKLGQLKLNSVEYSDIEYLPQKYSIPSSHLTVKGADVFTHQLPSVIDWGLLGPGTLGWEEWH